MILGRVIGEVWSTRKHPSLEGQKLVVVRPHLWYAPPHEVGHLVAVDTLDAGVGDDVVVCMGRPSRLALGSNQLPVEATVQAIVDRVDLVPQEERGTRSLAFMTEGL